MINTLGIEKHILEDSVWAIKEIEQQPAKWLETFELIEKHKKQLEQFLNEDDDVLFTGAGTSEYIGTTITKELNLKNKQRFTTVGSPDICTHPYYYFEAERKTILVSFGRGGTSPESQGAIEHADAIFKHVKHLIITCNPDGWMAQYAHNHPEKSLLLMMPEKTFDQSYAMTSSFTCMELAAYLCFNLTSLTILKEALKEISDIGQMVLTEYSTRLKSFIEDFKFEKFCALGSGTFKSLAQEAVIKILEVSAGVPGTWFDSVVGFRHGPSVIVQNNIKTLTIIFYENNSYANQYYDDLLEEIQTLYPGRNNRIIAISPVKTKIISKYADLFLQIDTDIKKPVLLTLPYIMIIHMIMLYKAWTYQHGSDLPFGRTEERTGILTKIYSIK